MTPEELNELLHFIYQNKLQFFWLKALRAIPDLPFPKATEDQLKNDCFRKSALYLMQKKTIIELDALLEKERIPYVLFKGTHTRELVYDEPAFRPAVDIDLLVSDNDKLRTIRLLSANDYALGPNQETVSHEVGLVKNNVHIDLHWHIMRPGRTRIELTELFLQSRQRYDFFWGLDNETTLLVLLSHPVFTKYATGPQSSIIWFVDLKEWISKRTINWQRLLQLLEDSGLKTPAWIMATVLDDLTGCQLPVFVQQAVTPNNLKNLLLQKWLKMNLSDRFADHPFLSKYIFTLLAHDSIQDVYKFFRVFREERKKETKMMERLQQVSQQQL